MALDTCFTLRGKALLSLAFTLGATADLIFGHVMRGERLRCYFSDGGCPTFSLARCTDL
jgi:hypothetical protein